MSTQRTDEDPGAGSTASLASLASKFAVMSAELEEAQGDVARCLEVFPEYWSGLAASAAQGRINAIKVRLVTLGDAAAVVKRALNRYVDELEAIQPLANDQIVRSDFATEQAMDIALELSALQATGGPFGEEKRNDLEMRLGEARDVAEDAVRRLLDLAARRQESDYTILEALRAELAEKWDLPPEAFPSDRSCYRKLPMFTT